MRKLCYWIHLWCGVSIALWLGVAGLTGSALVFRPELERSGQHVQPNGTPLDLDSLIRVATTHATNSKVRYLFPGAGADVGWQVEYSDGKRACIDPYRGTIIEAIDPRRTVLGLLREWHADLFSGTNGSKAVGFLGVASLVLVITGVIVWWPRLRLRTVQKTASVRLPKGKRAVLLHRWGGIAATPLLVVVVLTGVTLAWGEWSTQAARWLAGQPTPTPPVPSAGPLVMPWAHLVSIADQALPGGNLTRIALPAKPGGACVIRKRLNGEVHPNGMNFIHMDPANGKVLQIRTAAAQPFLIRLLDNRYPLHIGAYGGIPTRLLHFVTGLVLAALAGTGLVLAGRRILGLRRAQRRPERSHGATQPRGNAVAVNR